MSRKIIKFKLCQETGKIIAISPQVLQENADKLKATKKLVAIAKKAESKRRAEQLGKENVQ